MTTIATSVPPKGKGEFVFNGFGINKARQGWESCAFNNWTTRRGEKEDRGRRSLQKEYLGKIVEKHANWYGETYQMKAMWVQAITLVGTKDFGGR